MHDASTVHRGSGVNASEDRSRFMKPQMRLLILCLVSGTLILSLGMASFAQGGPPGYNRVCCLAIDPSTSTVYAGTSAVYKTTNGGTSWSPTGLTLASMRALVLD